VHLGWPWRHVVVRTVATMDYFNPRDCLHPAYVSSQRARSWSQPGKRWVAYGAVQQALRIAVSRRGVGMRPPSSSAFSCPPQQFQYRPRRTLQHGPRGGAAVTAGAGRFRGRHRQAAKGGWSQFRWRSFMGAESGPWCEPERPVLGCSATTYGKGRDGAIAQ